MGRLGFITFAPRLQMKTGGMKHAARQLDDKPRPTH
jgi:hypothetical protein